MKKILITTDFSANSRAGLRFAIQLASKQEYELTFFHSYHIMKPSTWTEVTFSTYEKSEAHKIQHKLEVFVNAVYKGMGLVPLKLNCVIKNSFMTDTNIMKYAADNKFNFICISRRGDGKLKKLFGTNTSNLIIHSKVPVIAVPNTYRRSELRSVLYASDLSNLDNEIGRVVEFAKPLNAEIELLHLNYPSDIVYNAKIIENTIRKFPGSNIKYRIENINLIYNLVANIQSVIKKTKPSILVMFTEKNQGFFDKLFLTSSSAEYSLDTTVPLLVFNK